MAREEISTGAVGMIGMTVARCSWAGPDPLCLAYHDEEWGVPEHDDRKLFELLTLEGAQAGLSWLTVLRKRRGYREVFDGFDPAVIASYDERRIEALRGDARIVRNGLKIRATVSNARCFLDVQRELGSFDAYLWRFVDGRPRQNARRTLAEVPATTVESDALSRDLRKRGFTFVGSTIMYAFMQATGLVNDHLTECYRHAPLSS